MVTTCLALSIVAPLGLSPTYAQTTPNRVATSCPEVFFVAARGTSQSSSADLGIGPEMFRLFRSYRAALVDADRRTSDTGRLLVTAPVAIEYPALAAPWPFGTSSQARYDDSVRRGVVALVADIELLARRCGTTTRFVLAGYSQGAQVVQQALTRIAPASRERLLGVVLVSSPRCAGEQLGVRYFGTRTCSGVFGRSNVPSWAARRTAHVCVATDLVCSARHTGSPPYRMSTLAPAARWATARTPALVGVPTCDGFVASRVGSSRDDVIRGTLSDDVIVGRGGNDTLDGRGGDDRICGDTGDDTLIAGQGSNVLRGGANADDCFGRIASNTFIGCEHLANAAPWSPRKVAVIGDSVPASALTGLQGEANRRGVELVSYVVPGCGIAIGPVADDNGTLIPWTPACDGVVGPGLAAFIDQHDPDAVIWWSSWESADRFVDGNVLANGSAAWRADLDAMLERRWQSVTSGGARVVLVDSTPRAPSPVGPADLDPDGDIAELRNRLHALAARHPDRTAVVEFSQVLCPAGVPCPAVVDGITPRPSDGGHFTDDTAPWVAARLWPLAADAWAALQPLPR